MLIFSLFSFQCLDTCKTISDEQTLVASNRWTVRVASMIKQEFLVATHLAWEPTNELIKCLISWETFGGGIMGNLLTDSSNVELSLWPDTKYRVQVTCKNKVSARSLPSLPSSFDFPISRFVHETYARASASPLLISLLLLLFLSVHSPS